jgi:hypothetical protein
MKRSEIKGMPEYFDRYINLVEDIDVIDALKKNSVNLFDKDKLKQLGDKVYAPGKWTGKEMLQHLIDGERIFTYRALRFARNDKTALPGFDENLYTPNSQAGRRSLDEILNEFDIVRQSSICLYQSFTDEMLDRRGACFSRDISVLALGFTIAGHGIHHTNLLKERYYTLL